MYEIFQNSLINLNFTKSSNQLTIKNFLKIFIKKESYKYKLNNLREIFDNTKVFFKKITDKLKEEYLKLQGWVDFYSQKNVII